MSLPFEALIVGAGHAGAHTAIFLRQHGHVGSIAIIGDEPELPYERPPLSKDYLGGTKSFDRLLLRPAEFWTDNAIAMLPGRRVETIDPRSQTVTCADGSCYSYVNLIWAAGGRPRSLPCPGGDLAGVHQIRSRADVDAIATELAQARDICVIGGGYIGLEAAAVLTKLGKRVTLLEAMDRVLARVAGDELSRFYEREHRAHGVDLRLNARVRELIGKSGRVAGVLLDEGEVLPAEMVIVGIGILPNLEPLAAAGARCRDGVEVDEFCRTSLPNIYAVGDCARHTNTFAQEGTRIRLESVQNASDQANCVAKAIVGRPERYSATPWFWSDQYDLRLQTAGLSAGYDEVVIRGDQAARKFSVIYLRGGRFQAIDCVNNAKDFVAGKRLVATRATVSADRLADTETPLKALIPPAVDGQFIEQDATARQGVS
ncbi:NAD(P)/FAD-dependent oxidoreductase [Bradyrhizobium iriomotense]|uniref:Pyridine nucleotide-disulfide oxidoreductase n=1 Tax=Bradyrhizobium iriomotense TaxID=441950 RepID=A0ABQ6ASS7_9BRAD|nr:FAD-dependent oxidoreductase [Bradyrhizobium iriomotense]GLR84618.1 pyridine nucleotide-disulfide oxidoreductase [Bradyrhizobium iriomotense]